MRIQPGFDRYQSFINSQFYPGLPRLAPKNAPPWRAVTISRQTGSGARTVGEKLAEILQSSAPKGAPPWTLFDRNLVEKVLADHDLPGRVASFLTEDRISEMKDTLDEFFGLHPQSWVLVRKTAETILRLVELGRVIIIGRGSAVITHNLDYVLHVRLVAPLEQRLQRVQEFYKLDARAARALIETEDRGRRRYLRKYFNRDIDDPLLHHLVINTGLVPPAQAARAIAHLFQGKC